VAHHSRAGGTALFVAALVVALSAAAVAPASAVENGEVGIRPAHEADFFHLSADAGTTTEAIAVVSNHTSEPMRLLTYPVDAIDSPAGFAMADMAAPRSKVGDWVDVGSTEITVPANSDAMVPFTLTVPEHTPSGSYTGALIIQSPPVEGAVTTVDGGTAVRLDVIQRQGVRIYLEVAGDAVPTLGHGELTWSNDGEALLFTLPLKNTGNVPLHPDAELELTGWGGDSTTLRFDAPDVLPPGASVEVSASLPDAPLLGVGDAEAAIASEAGRQRISAGYAYARWELIAAVSTALLVMLVAGWVLARSVRRARFRKARARLDPAGAAPGRTATRRSGSPAVRLVPRGAASGTGRHRARAPQQRRATWV
jgi:hypothetical protein